LGCLTFLAAGGGPLEEVMNLYLQTTYAVMTMPQSDGGDHQTNYRVNDKFNLWSFNYERRENFERKRRKRK
jgi:hypothetical protein